MLLCPAPSTQKGFARHLVGVPKKSSCPCQNGTTSSLPTRAFPRGNIAREHGTCTKRGDTRVRTFQSRNVYEICSE